ncbi:MAG: apolipoprotein N-acyltransferase [Burkholderiales bacterium]
MSGILQVLVFPSFSLFFLCWVAIAPLMVAILTGHEPDAVTLLDARGRDLSATTLWEALVLAFVNGFIFHAGTVFWIYHTLHVYGGISVAGSVGLFILLLIACSCHHAFFGVLLALAGRRSIRRALALAPFLWVTTELAWERIVGFPWQPLGGAQVDNILLTRIAPFTGVYGLSFEIALVSAAFAAAFLIPRERRRSMLMTGLAAAAILQFGILYRPMPSPATHEAKLVQENLPILEQWTPEFFEQTLTELARLSVGSARPPTGPPGLILWPESPAPFFVTDPQFRDAISQVARAANSYVVVGAIAVQSTSTGNRQPLNSAALIAPDGTWTARYDKIHLVPFGEFVPYKSIFFFIDKITKEAGEFGRGNDRKVFDVGGQKLGVLICYESIFPDEVRIFATNGAQVFANISNDEWFGKIGAPEQHLNMVRMRAIENDRWVLRATNTGITASIDPYGRVVTRAPRSERTTLAAPYALVDGTTFYTRHGDWFAYACAIISAVGLFARFNFRVQRGPWV